MSSKQERFRVTVLDDYQNVASSAAIVFAWRDIIPPIVIGSVKPIVERVFPLGEAGEALRHLTEDRPFGNVVLTG